MKKIINSICIVLILLMPLMAFGKKELNEIRVLLEKKELDTALSMVEKFLNDSPKQPEALFLKGLILFESGNISESIDVFKLLTQEYPSKPELYNNLAVAYAVQGDYLKAKDALQKAIEIYPGYTKAHENLGDIYMNIARNAYEKALQLDPEKKTLQSKLDHINNLPIMQGQPKKNIISKKEDTDKSQQLKPVQETPKEQIIKNVDEGSISKVEAKKIAEAVVTKEVQKMARSKNEEKTVNMTTDPCQNWDTDKAKQIQEQENILKTIDEWAKKWSEMDVDSYISFYSEEFKPSKGMSFQEWKDLRKQRLNKNFIKVTVRRPKITFTSCNNANVIFNQKYESDGYKDYTNKLIIMKKINSQWKIIHEGKAP